MKWFEAAPGENVQSDTLMKVDDQQNHSLESLHVVIQGTLAVPIYLKVVCPLLPLNSESVVLQELCGQVKQVKLLGLSCLKLRQ